jgi:hypothetical protein
MNFPGESDFRVPVSFLTAGVATLVAMLERGDATPSRKPLQLEREPSRNA